MEHPLLSPQPGSTQPFLRGAPSWRIPTPLHLLESVQLQSCSSYPQFSHMCPDTWIGFQSKCYYFSENRNDWNTSLENFLGRRDRLNHFFFLKAFIKHYTGQRNHWLGLHEEGDGQWRWTNRTAFNSWSVWRGGPCAYLNQEMISSAFCHTEKYWICSRPNNYVLWRQKISPE
uniref:C-type lectin domain-containing protein n=1 Tax=Anas platyrhynchos platyrhynchos TaxID=8840 RepID=A0A493T5Y1_ANAPP